MMIANQVLPVGNAVDRCVQREIPQSQGLRDFGGLVDLKGLEPSTSRMRTERSPS